jgi:glycosyltransferase involved in cell wall biosynthesis
MATGYRLATIAMSIVDNEKAGPATDAAAQAAVRAFRDRHPALAMSPVAVVIPAYDEEACVGAVIDAIPGTYCGLAVDTIVVDDGSRDATSDVARRHGALVARREPNGGQGAAFQIGYRIAREHGARFIVTLDADGQWDPADVPAVLEPVVNGEADFVLGSRVLGDSETRARFRSLGVRVYSGLVRLLTGARVTDTSSGLRAMVAELTAVVPQHEPQYQASELLLGALACGYRVAERPVVMHERTAGESKKGHDVLYGLRYGRVLVRTWWRTRRSLASAARP